MSAYTPEEVELFALVLAQACRRLKIEDGFAREAAAERIFCAAESGERDPVTLLTHAISDGALIA